MEIFLKVFQKIGVHVVLVLTNIIIGQLNIKVYDSDNGIPKFCFYLNIDSHLHLVLFGNWHEDIMLNKGSMKSVYE